MLSELHFLIILAIVIIIGVISYIISSNTKIPDVIVLILAGLGLHYSGVLGDALAFSQEFTTLVIIIGASYLIFEGAAGLDNKTVNKVIITIASLAILGVIISIFILGPFISFLTGTPLLIGLLIAAIVAGTDPAVLIPLMKDIKLHPRLSQTIISESALNDATSSLATSTILGIVLIGASINPLNILNVFAQKLLIGGITGAILGLIFIYFVNIKDIFSKYAGEISIVVVLFSFVIAEMLGGSGFVAVFSAGLILAYELIIFKKEVKFDYQTKYQIEHTAHTLITILKIFIFIILGANIDIWALTAYWWHGILIALFYMIVVRPITVVLSALWDKRAQWGWNEIIFLSWTRQTGVIPASLLALVMTQNVPNKEAIQAIVMIIILMTIVIQNSTAGILARKLNLTEKE